MPFLKTVIGDESPKTLEFIRPWVARGRKPWSVLTVFCSQARHTDQGRAHAQGPGPGVRYPWPETLECIDRVATTMSNHTDRVLLSSGSAQTKEERTLKGKALECISLVGMAVGRDIFR